MSSKKTIDWEAIERDFRVGQLSLRALATKHGTTAGAISKKASAGNWVKDASEEVRERTRAALLTEPRKERERQETADGNTVSSSGNAPTQGDIEVAVQTNLQVINRHRRDIAKGHGLVNLLFRQLEQAASAREELEDEVIEETAGDTNCQRRNRMLKALSLPTHAGVLRDLSTALKNLIPLERQAYNLDEQEHEEPYEERLRRLLEQDG
ncbi:hypothetical protein GO594_13080 [Pseudomonas otitidis]|uniref:Uncharacterized protein n=1 Tax=Metapseudomonas otitidis TaxID=319939 RepID=A0A7X3KVE2_9GAMM|nr:hypothetical protein [Pseudomonas otitidis]MWK56913.1 hypothetical protein [Pseudomonas otitidis]